MRIEMEELLYSYGVDIVFNGHVRSNLFLRVTFGIFEKKKKKKIIT